MHLWQGGEPQTTQASHIPLWLRPSDRKRQGAPQGLSAEDQSARVGGRLSAELQRGAVQRSSVGVRRPHSAPQRPTSPSWAHARPTLSLRAPAKGLGGWHDEAGRPQQVSFRSSACLVEPTLPMLLSVPQSHPQGL